MRTSALRVLCENGTLKGEFVPGDPYTGRFARIRPAPEMFTFGLYDESGQIDEALRPEVSATFTREGGRPATCELRDEQDRLWAKGRRKP